MRRYTQVLGYIIIRIPPRGPEQHLSCIFVTVFGFWEREIDVDLYSPSKVFSNKISSIIKEFNKHRLIIFRIYLHKQIIIKINNRMAIYIEKKSLFSCL